MKDKDSHPRLAVDPLLQVPSIQSIKFTTWQDIAPVLEQHLSNRQPVIIRQVLDSSKLSESDLLRGLGDEDITVRVISSPFTDDREHNLAPVFTNKSSEGRHWLDVVPIEELFSDISSFAFLLSREGHARVFAAPAILAGDDEPRVVAAEDVLDPVLVPCTPPLAGAVLALAPAPCELTSMYRYSLFALKNDLV